MIQIFTISDGSVREYQQGVRLDGSDYVLKLSWNSRAAHWILSLYQADLARTPIAEGRMVVLYTDLLRGVVADGVPPGQIVAFPEDGALRHAGFTGLGGRVTLGYRSIDDP